MKSNNPTNVLTIRNLVKRYGDATAVNGVSLTVEQNQIVGLLGPNGAGKTTIINSVLGVLQPTSGTIHIQGHDISKERTKALSRTNFAAVYAPLPGNLTVVQNLRIFGRLYGVEKLSGRIEALLAQFDLEKFRNTKCGVLSSGEQTRVSLAKAMLNSPVLLLLDEPTASLDPAAAADIREMIRKMSSSGFGGVLWTSHNMYEVESVCDHVIFLMQGKVLLSGDPRTLPAEQGKSSLEDLFIALAKGHTDAISEISGESGGL